MAGEDDFNLEGLFGAPEEVEDASDTPAESAVEATADTVGEAEEGQGVKEVQEEPTPSEEKGKQPAEGEESQKMVPLSALHEQRQQNKALEARLAALEVSSKKREEESPTPIFGRELPDPKEDPEGFAMAVQEQTVLLQVNNNLQVSEAYAKGKYGDELVEAVRDWALKRFETDPEFAQRILFDPQPYEAGVREYQAFMRGEKLSKIDPEILDNLNDDEVALIRAHRAQRNGGGSTDPNPPRGANGQFRSRVKEEAPESIIDKPSAGKPGQAHVKTGEGAAFDSVFG